MKCKHLVISFSLMYFSFQLTAEKDKIFEVKLISFIGIFWKGFIVRWEGISKTKAQNFRAGWDTEMKLTHTYKHTHMEINIYTNTPLSASLVSRVLYLVYTILLSILPGVCIIVFQGYMSLHIWHTPTQKYCTNVNHNIYSKHLRERL